MNEAKRMFSLIIVMMSSLSPLGIEASMFKQNAFVQTLKVGKILTSPPCALILTNHLWAQMLNGDCMAGKSFKDWL